MKAKTKAKQKRVVQAKPKAKFKREKVFLKKAALLLLETGDLLRHVFEGLVKLISITYLQMGRSIVLWTMSETMVSLDEWC